MRITREEVRITAAMARLSLSEEEIGHMTVELDRILAHAEQLQEVDVEGVEPTTHAVPLSCPLRADEVTAHLPAEVALSGAPRRDGAYFVVPAILNRDEP